MAQSPKIPSSHSSDQFDIERACNVVDDMLSQAKKSGASAAEGGVSIETGLSVNVRLGEVDTLEHNRDKGLGITVYFGQQKGSASTSDFSAKAIRETVQAACDIARYTEADPAAGLARAELMAKDIPELDLYHPWSVSAEEAIGLATACEAEGREASDKVINSEGASVNSHDGLRVYGNSHGFLGNALTSRQSISCTLIAEDENGMQRDYWYSVARDAEDLDSAKEIGQRAAQRTIARLGAKRIGTMQVPVIFQADVARGVLSHFLGAIRGGNLYRKASFLVDAIGQQIFPDNIRIDERPHLKGALGSAAFDNEGVATQPRDIVTDGVLQGYILDSYAARRLGMDTTGNAGGVHNLFISDNAIEFSDLIHQMDKGLIITEVMGQGVNTVTGDYSRGASGFWVENGEIQHPVEEITLASTLQEMYKGIELISNDVDRRGNVQTGSWLINKMMVAGES